MSGRYATRLPINAVALSEMTQARQSRQDIGSILASIAPYIEAAKVGDGEDIQKWKREKFDTTFAKYIHRYFLGQKAKGKLSLDENAYKDLHFMTHKYIELIGSVEFNTYLQQTIN